MLTLNLARKLVIAVLPLRELDKEYVLEVITYYLRRNFASYLSHRKKKLKLLEMIAC